LSKRGIKPTALVEQFIKIALVSLFFSVDCSFVVQELENRSKFRHFMHIRDVPSIDALYRFFSRWEEDQLISCVSGILNSGCTRRRKRGITTFLIDSTAITIDLNWIRKMYSKAQLEKKSINGVIHRVTGIISVTNLPWLLNTLLCIQSAYYFTPDLPTTPCSLKRS
jgi:hypothetical protein